jgi:phosphate transport system substrate-binding protein
MRKNLFVIFATLIVASLVLAACGAPAAAPAETAMPVVQTQIVEKVVEVTPTVDPSMPTPMAAGSVQLNGAGATFPAPIYTDWAYAYQYVDPSVVVNYQAIGSGGGKKAIVDGTVDFAGSDSLLKDEEYAAGKDLQMYPTVAGAVVVTYNIKWAQAIPTPAAGAKAPVLILDRATLVGIYNGTINKWNDPAILATNPDLKDYLPSDGITVVHRSDGSGTTEIFTKALSSFSPDWKAGGAQSVEWPADKAGNGVGGKGNAGVAASVINTPNSLGYVELGYATSNGMPYASLINQAGKTIVPSNNSVQAAMTEFAGGFTDKLTNTIVDGKSDGAYPITGYTYLILHTTSMTDCVKAQKVLEFFKWALTDPTALERTAKLGYSPLPDAVRKTVFDKFAAVTCNGEPALK